MIEQNKSRDQDQPKDTAAKVGDSRDAARKIGGKGDFGIPEKKAEREMREKPADYAGRPAGSHMTATGDQGKRDHPVGADPKHGARGKGSGGEIDPDIVGFGTAGGGSMTTDGELNRDQGPDIVEPSEQQKRNPKPKPNIGGNRQVKGTTVDQSGGDVSTTGSGGGTGNVANAQHEVDDAFAGEVSLDEGRGADNSPQDNE